MALVVGFLLIEMLTAPKLKVANAQATGTIESFGEPITLTSTSTWIECHYFNPLTYNGTAPTNPSDRWSYADSTCTDPTIQNVLSGTSTFYLDKTWSYGDLLISFLLLVSILLFIFLIIFSFFFEPVFKIRGRQ